MVGTDKRPRCVTGIDGLDNILGGGVPLASMVLISGSCGTGKSSLALEFLVRGAMEKEKGLLITTVEPPEKLLSNVVPLDFFDEKMVKNGSLQFLELGQLMENVGIYGSSLERKDIIGLGSSLGSFIEKSKIKRLVIDSFSGLLRGVSDPNLSSEFMLALSEVLYNNECTGMLVSDSEPCGKTEGAIADGVIVLSNYERGSDLLRTIQVIKMKGTSHSRARYVIDLTPCGLLMTPLLRGGQQ